MIRMDPGSDRKFLYLLMVVLFLLTTKVVSKDSSKKTDVKKPIKVSTLMQPPLVMRDGNHRFTGIMIDVLKEIGYEIGYQEVEAKDDRLYGLEEVPGRLADVVDEVEQGRADVAIVLHINRLTNHSGITHGITYSLPVYTEGFIPIFKPLDKWSPNYLAMLTPIEPFSPGLWCLIIAMCMLTSAFLFLIRYLSPFEASGNDRSPPSKSSFMYMIGALLGQDHRDAPRSLSGRVVTCVWWVFALMTAGAYVAGLVTIIYRMDPKINTLPFSTLDEMVKQDKVKVLVVKDGVTHDYVTFRKGPIYDMFHNKKESLVVDSMDTALKMAMEGNGEYAIFLQQTTGRYLINEPPCKRMQVTESFGSLFYGFACKTGADICDELEKGILHLQETGKIEELQNKYYEGACHKKEQFSYQGLPFVSTFGVGDPTWLYPRTLNIQRFASAFALLIVGVAVAILVLIAEVIYAKWRGPQFSSLAGRGLDEDIQTQRLNDQEQTSNRDSYT